jgi:acetolactate synthase-1/2/3 large subunit
MHFVAAVDHVPEMRTVLGLFEGVCTGAADGYARMAGRPAATLLHLGPGLGNGIANLHNARRAQTPLVNIVGDHASYHLQHDAPLTSDIESLAWSVSGWVRTCATPASVPQDAADAIRAATTAPGQVATLILPGDCAWNESVTPLTQFRPPPMPTFRPEAVDAAARILHSGADTVLLIGGDTLKEQGIQYASRLAAATGARLFASRPISHMQRGAGRPLVERLPYFVPQALKALEGAKHIILVGAQPPVAFFAYPNMPNTLAPEDCQLHMLAGFTEDGVGALGALVETLNVPEIVTKMVGERPPQPSGTLTVEKIWMALGGMMPENAIISDEAITSSRGADEWTAVSPPHDWLSLAGGAIGQGMPLSVGAAVACPDRKVFAMQADGSAMYTVQALWTQAREQLDVITVLFSNRAYAILQHELRNVGAAAGPKAQEMLNLDNPTINWAQIANGMGVNASRAETAEAFTDQLAAAIYNKGPHLIEAII